MQLKITSSDAATFWISKRGAETKLLIRQALIIIEQLFPAGTKIEQTTFEAFGNLSSKEILIISIYNPKYKYEKLWPNFVKFNQEWWELNETQIPTVMFNLIEV